MKIVFKIAAIFIGISQYVSASSFEIGIHKVQRLLIDLDRTEILAGNLDEYSMPVASSVPFTASNHFEHIQWYEVDVEYLEIANSKFKVFVSHGTPQESVRRTVNLYGGKLIPLVLFLDELDKRYKFRHVWIDFKNISIENASRVVSQLKTEFPKYSSRMLIESTDAKSLQILSANGYNTLYWVRRSRSLKDVFSATKRISQWLPYFMKQKSIPADLELFAWTNKINKDNRFESFRSFIEENPQMFCLILFDYPIDPVFYKLEQQGSCNL